MLMEFSLKLLYSTLCGKNIQFYRVHILRKCIDSRHFYSCHSHSKLAQKFLLSSTIDRRKLLIPLGSILSKICFPQQQKGVEETMICLIKIQSENMRMTWDVRLFIFFVTCYFFKSDGFIVL